MLSLDQNPPQLITRYDTPDQVPGDWWIAHVKSRNEKKLAWDLEALGIPYYLPMIQRETFSGNRKRQNLYPLFASYLFFAGSEQTRYRVLTTNRAACVIEVNDQDRFRSEIASIHRVISNGDELEFVQELPIGRQVEVTQGPFKGMIGTVVGNRPWNAISLSIAVLGVGAELKISGDVLDLIDE